VPEAEILREGVKLAALGARLWDKPMVGEGDAVDLGGPVSSEDVHEARGQAARAKSERIEDHR